ncbi:serine hydrolase [Streptomyces sp. ASQP_92]|uniref:serine hydrolase n=1 Tax=Streptomyces sp. ASQP_92 TaxID=2979116 RepID=UPI0021C02D24|nr:serine hydrolase [Streptomyces sp. ASQP_92]MCT9092984.1 serine hydrolase [Streptomyces sp. ASQP_92]
MVRTVSDDATRRLEEASVAGESPDKSEQKQSSGETTTSERDPRLAVSRGPSPSREGVDDRRAANGSGEDSRSGSGSGSASGSAGTDGSGSGSGTDGAAAGSDGGATGGSAAGPVDQATAVFRAPRPEDGDSRLRAAVAAWVDQEDAPEGDGAAPTKAAEPGNASGAKPASDGPDAGAVDAESASAGADLKPTGSDSATSPVAANSPSAHANSGLPSAKATTADAGSASDDAGSDAVEKRTATPSKSAGDATPADAKPTRADTNATAAGSGKSTPAGAEPTSAGAGEPTRAVAKLSSADAGEANPAGAKPTSAGAAQPTRADAKPSSADTGEATPAGAKPTSAGAAQPTPTDAKPAPVDPAPTPSDQPKSSPSRTPDRGPGVDQPTAVFKAVKPPTADETRAAKAPAEGQPAVTPPPPAAKAPAAKAPVDQPTAMLKLPAPQRESAGERVSQFVPLRSDDAGTRGGARSDASVRRPEGPKVTPPPAAPAGPAGPTPPVPERAERTRQQPLPPKPPLDLLAELTNTPPPAQTAVRSTVRRFKIWTPLVLLLIIVFAVVQLMRPLPDPKLALTSSATYTFDGSALDLPWPSEGQSAVSVDGVGSLGTHGEQKPAPLASVAKTMTAYVILKGHPISGKQEGEKITVDQQAEDDAKKPDESTAPIRKDQQFTEKQMLELLMIPSGNNAARLLARWDAGSEEAFIAKMNDAAKALGMTSTTYTDPSGLKETTVSTPTDQLKLAQAVMQNDVFRGIVNTPQIKIPGIDTMIYNNNTILLKPGVSGIKTGSSTPAGGNLLWAADTVVDGKNQRIYGIVMGQRTGTTLDNKLKSAINNSYTLIQAVQKAVTSATVVKKGDVVGYVDDGLGGKTPLVAAKDLKAVGWPGLKVDITLGGAGGKPVPHAAKAGEVVGELSIGSGNGRLSAPVELKKALAEPGTGDKLTRLG